MIKLGVIQELEYVKESIFGAYLNDEKEEEGAILLPKNQVPDEFKLGDTIEVFVYRDSKDRIIATTVVPAITLGEIKELEVVQMTKIGAFLDWGLLKDLLLPFSEQKGEVKQGSKYLVGLYVDKSDRLCATMDIGKQLSTESTYEKDEWLNGTIYSQHEEIGLFVAVENKFDGLIPGREVFGEYKIGDQVKVRITRVQEDGKLDLSLKEKSYMQMDTDAKIILEELEKHDGKLPLNDKSDAELIKSELQMSKRGFKRGVGRLLKDQLIIQTDEGIELKR